jgi:hypothetical protein
MSQDRPPAKTPEMTSEQKAEAYSRGTPAARRASVIVLLVIWLVVIGAVLLLVFVFHKTAHNSYMRY